MYVYIYIYIYIYYSVCVATCSKQEYGLFVMRGCTINKNSVIGEHASEV
jgi:hypothetical protein